MLIFAMWYKRSEQPFRMGFWIGSAGLAYIIAGIAAFGIGHMHAGLASWRLIYLVRHVDPVKPLGSLLR